MIFSNLILFILILSGFAFLKGKSNKFLVITYLLLFLFTPWFWMMFFNVPNFSELSKHKPYPSFLGNFELVLNFEYLFFRFNEKIFSITGDLGYFLPSFIPWFFVGLYKLVDNHGKKLIFLGLVNLFIAATFAYFWGFVAFLFILPLISLVSAVGLVFFYSESKKNKLLAVLFTLNVLLMIYEGLRMLRIIQMQLNPI